MSFSCDKTTLKSSGYIDNFVYFSDYGDAPLDQARIRTADLFVYDNDRSYCIQTLTRHSLINYMD